MPGTPSLFSPLLLAFCFRSSTARRIQVGPVARADPLVCDMVTPRLGYMLGNFRAMDMIKREAPEKLKVGTVSMYA